MIDAIEYIRPSRLQQAALCPGSYRMQQGIEETPSPEAQEGTMLHDRVRTGDLSGLDTEQADAVRRCIEFRDNLREQTGLTTLRSEQPLELRDTQGNLLTKGTTDVLLTGGTGAPCAIVDWKFGRTPVEDAASNLQGASYALGAMQLTGAKSCTFHVFQPRIKKHTSYTFTKPEAIIANIDKVIKRATGESLILNAGEACRYCKAKGVCPAFRRTSDALAVVRDNADALTTPEKLADYYSKAQIVKRFCTQVEKAMKAYLDEHGECAGYRYQESAGEREVNDIEGAASALSGILTNSEFLGCCTASICKLEALFIEKACAAATAKGQKLTKKDAKAQFESETESFIQRGTPTRKIVLKEQA